MDFIRTEERARVLMELCEVRKAFSLELEDQKWRFRIEKPEEGSTGPREGFPVGWVQKITYGKPQFHRKLEISFTAGQYGSINGSISRTG